MFSMNDVEFFCRHAVERYLARGFLPRFVFVKIMRDKRGYCDTDEKGRCRRHQDTYDIGQASVIGEHGLIV